MSLSENDFEHRKNMAIAAYASISKLLKSDRLPLKLRVEILETAVLSILLYGCEAWIVTNKIETNINSFATSRYRELLKIKWHDKVKNEDILRLVDRKPLVAQVRKRQLGWLGHALRRDAAEPSRVFALRT
jgi:hypothetical protein